MIGEPIALAPETVTTADPFPITPFTDVGALGLPAEVTEAEDPLVDELPIAFVATAVNVYATPSVSPVTAQDLAFASVAQVNPSGFDVIV